MHLLTVLIEVAFLYAIQIITELLFFTFIKWVIFWLTHQSHLLHHFMNQSVHMSNWNHCRKLGKVCNIFRNSFWSDIPYTNWTISLNFTTLLISNTMERWSEKACMETRLKLWYHQQCRGCLAGHFYIANKCSKNKDSESLCKMERQGIIKSVLGMFFMNFL